MAAKGLGGIVVRVVIGGLAPGLLIVCFAMPVFGREFTLYDVDFASPPHTVGSEPVIAGGPPPRDTPDDSLLFTSTATATVVSASNGLVDQPVELSTGGSCQFHCIANLSFETFDPEIPEFDFYRFTGTVVVDPAETAGNGVATIIVDVFGQAYALRFTLNGQIRAGRAGFETLVGYYTLGVPVAFEITADTASDEWTAAVDGVPLHVEDIVDAPLHRLVVISSANAALLPGSKALVAYDDLLIRVPVEDILPAASPTGLVVLAGVVALFGRRELTREGARRRSS